MVEALKVDVLLEELCARVKRAEIAALELRKRNQEARSAVGKRDNALYAFLACASRLVVKERELAQHDLRALRKARFPLGLPKMSVLKKRITLGALRMAGPAFDAGTRSKYAAVIDYAIEHKRGDQTFLNFLKAHGRIDECVQKAITARDQHKKQGRG